MTERPGLQTQGTQRATTALKSMTDALGATKRTMPGLDVRFSAITGAPTLVRNSRGALTKASAANNETIARAFLRSHGDLYGLSSADVSDLVVVGDSKGGRSGLRMLRVEQQINGRPVFQSDTRILIDRDGRVVSTAGAMVPHARSLVPAINDEALISAAQAVSRLLAAEGRTADASLFSPSSSSPTGTGVWKQLDETDEYVAGTVFAREVLFPIAPGALVPAWAVVVFTSGDADWYAIIDAEHGHLLWRKNIRASVSAHDARFRVFVQADGVTPADSPAPASPNLVTPGSGTQFAYLPPTIVAMHTAMDAAASPNGWIDDCPGGVCTANETQTLGNNALVCLDRTVGGANTNVCDTDANSVLDGNGRPTGNPDANSRNRDFLGTSVRDFDSTFTPPPQTTAADAEVGQNTTGTGAAFNVFRRGAVTHLFYITNWYHDKLFALGFDEGAGNFQQTNFSGMGLGGDRVLGDAQDGSGTNNANFATPPDGVSGRMQMYRFTGPTSVDRDGGLDAEIVMHELTHGTSNRLVGNGAGLNWDPASGMGEGWSDFYALSLLNNTNADDPNGQYASGGYATYKLIAGYQDNYLYGIRRFPYSTNHSVNPMTWADVDDVTISLAGGIAPSPVNFNDNGGMEVHNIGEIWALTLWEVRSRIIADPAGANGDVPTGNQTTLQLVTDALKMTPIDPSFVEARDAILDADCATNACANEGSIWGGFADRGLGWGATTPYNVAFGYTAAHMGVHESFSSPYLDVVSSANVAIDDSASNNNASIDPGEAIRLTVSLFNPWRGASYAVASATGVLSTTTPGVTIYDNSATWGAIGPQTTTAASDTFLISLDTTVACGSSLDFTLTTTSTLGVTTTTFTLRVGNANGTDSVVTYTRDTTPDLAIPDGRPRAVFDSMTITDDFEIADLDFRVDSVTHTFTGDLTFMLRSPGGIGVDQVALIGGLTDGGSGNDIVNMVADDDVASTAANDMVQVTAAGAPYTKSWLPVFNAPWTTLAGFPAPDAVGTFSRLDGTSTKGTWTV
ncbi:MAG: M36 family metallopeptidase, partial [Thermoanaerobaculia bacterium]